MQTLIKRIRPSVILYIILSLLCVPVSVLADEESLLEDSPKPVVSGTACVDGKNDADQNVSTMSWAIPGFLCGIFGFAFALASTPTVPADNLIGRDPDYVTVYSSCYVDKAKSKQTTSACIGWAAAIPVVLILTAGANTAN